MHVLFVRLLCTLYHHPIRVEPDPPGEHTLMQTCPCARYVVWIGLDGSVGPRQRI